ncbi:MarR family winged helix-turn-helix transcriptional regulator [Corynebacterium comes]|uniref:DNA-binding transcriptional repressor MarR n=1 Tax=Corynebacterium comes TaxID=2675218 RepID=A0A6B8W0N1_9CORY|nr:MarR family transcriptional regulator [Corynebacterium comes]QGU05567.1 DNA-binding transcriptional repressor MarR [Corynebacterium comes]
MIQKKDSPTVEVTMTTGVPLSLLESPSFQLERLRRRTRDCVESSLSTRDTTMREYWVLTCLTERDASSQTALSESLAIDASDMVRLIDALETKSWAKRDRDPRDRRRQIVTLTKAGAKAQAELAVLVTQAESAALDESTGKQLKHLRKLTQAVLTTESAEPCPEEPDEHVAKGA